MPVATLSFTATGPRDPADAWERYADPARWPEWSPQIRYAETAATRLAAGVTGRVHVWGAPPPSFRVTAFDDAARTWGWDVALGPLRLHLDHDVEARPAGGSRTRLRLVGPLPLVLAYAPAARLALGRLVR